MTKKLQSTGNTNVITLNVFNRKPSSRVLARHENDKVIDALHSAAIAITDRMDLKGYALVAWDKKGVPCISYYAEHPENPISDMMIPSFTQTCFQGIVSQRLSKPEDLDGEEQ